jgi:hypothetical protein
MRRVRLPPNSVSSLAIANGRLTSVPDVQSGPLVATPAETMAKAAGRGPGEAMEACRSERERL